MSASYSINESQAEPSAVDILSHPLGNSERIRLRYGSYGINILNNNTDFRISSLYSTHDNVKTSRTIAVVAFQDINEQAFSKEHDAIINGQSIGIVFKNNGWVIDKQHQFFGVIETPVHYFSESPPPAESGKTQSAIHVYSLMVRKAGLEFHYATIAEIHHPNFLQLSDLAGIYGSKFESHRNMTMEIADFLDVIESSLLAL